MISVKQLTFFKSGCVRHQQEQRHFKLALVAANLEAPVPAPSSGSRGPPLIFGFLMVNFFRRLCIGDKLFRYGDFFSEKIIVGPQEGQYPQFLLQLPFTHYILRSVVRDVCSLHCKPFKKPIQRGRFWLFWSWCKLSSKVIFNCSYWFYKMCSVSVKREGFGRTRS